MFLCTILNFRFGLCSGPTLDTTGFSPTLETVTCVCCSHLFPRFPVPPLSNRFQVNTLSPGSKVAKHGIFVLLFFYKYMVFFQRFVFFHANAIRLGGMLTSFVLSSF